jgi:hypothetical protein
VTVKLELLREQDFGFYEGKSFLEQQKDSSKNGKDTHRETHANAEGFQDVESKESMKARMDTFIDSHLVEHMRTRGEDETVAIVAHGIILSHLWRRLLRRFDTSNIAVVPGVQDNRGMGLEYLGGWSNTGYLDLEIKAEAAAHRSPETDTSRDDAANSATLADVSIPSLTNAATPEVPPESPTAVITSAIESNPVNLILTTNLWNMSVVIKAVNSLEHLKGLKKTRGGIGSAKHDDKQQTVDSFFKKRRIE